MQMDIPHQVFGNDLPKATMQKTLIVDIENLGKQLHEARHGSFLWSSDEPPILGGDDNHPQPLTYITAGIGQ